MAGELLEAADEEAALERLHEMQCTDGLPVVIPTARRVERMVLAGGLDPVLSVGTMGPLQGAATVEKVAVAVVMAGCLPEHFPVVLAAVRAACDPRLDLTAIQSTTHNLAPLMIVNGPVRNACGIASGHGALGPGHRANASIGRALRLAMINIGGGRAGVSDMALLGHPGKFTYCLAEAEEDSPFAPLHTTFGYDAEQSTVTLVCVEGPHSVMCGVTEDDGADRLLEQFAAALSNPGSNNIYYGRGAQVVVINPEHADRLMAAGLDRRAVQERLAELAVRPLSQVRGFHASNFAPSGERGGGGVQGLDPAGRLNAIRDPSDVVIVVAGGRGGYSAVMPSWGHGVHANTMITQLVEVDQACEVPWAR